MRIAFLDDILARLSPNRLMLYFLASLFALALGLSLAGKIAQTPAALALHAGLMLAICWAGNQVFAAAFKVHTNPDSVLITALILVLVISPPTPLSLETLELPLFAGLWAMASKYLFTLQRRAIFNPAAFGIWAASLLTGTAASWWVGNLWSLGLVLAGGLLVLRKMRCLDLVLPFAVTVLVVSTLSVRLGFAFLFDREILMRSSLAFFAFVMLTEPRTVPIGRPWRLAFAVLVGLLYAPATHIGSFRFTPELALLIGNIFALAGKFHRRRLAANTRAVATG